MKRNVFAAVLALSFLPFSALKAQIHVTAKETEGVFGSSLEFVENSIRKPGRLTKADEVSVTFMARYKEVTYTPNNVWGYRDAEGNDYRSIDGKFFKIAKKEAIWVYECGEAEKMITKISLGAKQIPQDLTPDFLAYLLRNDEKLFKEYLLLNKKDKKEKAFEYIDKYNVSASNKIDNSTEVSN